MAVSAALRHFHAQCPHNTDKGAGKGSPGFGAYVDSGPIGGPIGMVTADEAAEAPAEMPSDAPQAAWVESQIPVVNRVADGRIGPFGKPAQG